MPRIYKPNPNGKKYKKYDDLIIKQALEELTLNRHATIRSVAEKFNISKSVLQRHSTRQMRSQGGQMALTIEEEEHIVLNLNTCAEWGYPLDVTDLRFLVKSYLDMLGMKHKRFKDNLPGRDFVYSFLNRHKNRISQRLCQNIKRARAAVSPTTINEYFSELEKSIENVPLGNIINYDETNLSDDPGRHKVLTKRGCKYPERIVNHSKASISLMMAGTAEGELLPPYVVYKSVNLYDTWVKNGPEHARYNRTTSGWFDATVFKDWVKEVVIPFFEKKQGKKVLVGDNLSSHLSTDLIMMCKSRDINFVFLPANSTHLTQPLDVAFFRPMKIAWRQILQNWKKSDGRSLSCVPKGCFPRLLKLLMDQIKINAENNLRAGFRKTGISPLNPSEVLARLPKQTENNEEVKDAIDKSVLALLKEMRYGTMYIAEPKNKRKIEVISGRSVSHEDMASYADTDTEPEMKKKRKQQIKVNKSETKKPSKSKNQKDVRLKGKGVGKKTKKICDEKENKSPSPIPHCSFESIADEKQCPRHEQQHNDWLNIDVEKMPVILSEDLQLYEEIIIPMKSKDSKETNVIYETDSMDIENGQDIANNIATDIYEHAKDNSEEATNENTKHINRPNIIITSNTDITREELQQLLPKTPVKQTMRPIAVNKNITIKRKQTKKFADKKNYFNDSEDILKILESD